jgi:3-methyl-2-oxobutanoate hydroxymethyltransferase
MEDMLGLSPRVPKFVKEFGRIGAAIEGAIKSYSEEVRARRFPEPAHTYTMKDEPGAEAGASATVKSSKKAKNPSPREA